MSEWISVEDRLPEEGVDVLITWNSFPLHGPNVMLDYIQDGKFSTDASNPPASHWMPLPDPPND